MKLLNPIPESKLSRFPFGNIYQEFGENYKLYFPRFGIIGHNGIDITGMNYHGKSVVAAHSGIAVNVYYNKNVGGQVINIQGDQSDANGDVFQTCYGHLIKDSQTVKIGDKVIAGQEIGKIGNSGFIISGKTIYWGDAPNQIGSHLHFSVYIFNNGKVKYPNNGFNGAVDPMPYLTGTYEGYFNIFRTLKDMLEKMLRSY